jgi:hypothetical protein
MSGADQRVSANVIPFTKPRAISSLPATFSPVSNVPAAGPSWGSAAKQQPVAPANPWASNGSTWGTNSSTSYSAHGNAAVAKAPLPVPSPTPTSVAMPALPARMPQATTPPPIVAAQAPRPDATIPQVNLAAMQAHAAVTKAMPAQTAPVVAPVAAPSASKWSSFESLGLRAPKIDHKKWSKHVVTAYRLLGFVILTVIVLALVSYLITTAFFYVSQSWVVPMAISPTDEKVVSLQSQLAERQTNRDRTAAELDQAERAIEVQQQFQLEFAKAIKSDLEGRKAALARMYELANKAASTRAQIKRSSSAYASVQQKRMAEEWKAGLIDRDEMINGKFQQAQISGSNLSLAERQAEYETRAEDLESQTRSLEALLSDSAGDASMSYDVLRIKQEYEASRLETQRAIENRDMLKSALVREDKLLEALKNSSYLKAMADEAHVAFVPYSNLSNVKKGAPLYGCAMTMVFCKKVGTVVDVLPGEVTFKHPNKDKQLRGQMVELKLDSAESATDDVLFVGGRPMLL